MSWVTVGDAELLECAGCEGTWLEADTFERLCASRESQAAVLHTSRDGVTPPAMSRQPVRYRPCLRCGKMMNRVNFGRVSGAVVDVCKGHGTFLDRGELHQIVRFIQSGGLDRARQAERDAIVEEQRRLRDLERTHERVGRGAPPEGFSWKESTVLTLLSELIGPK
jgi:Zn-finger nucleic acid-binding protein